MPPASTAGRVGGRPVCIATGCIDKNALTNGDSDGFSNRCNIDKTAPHVYKWGDAPNAYYHDPLHHEVEGGKCVYYNTTQTECTSGMADKNGEWVSTERSEENCLRMKQCQGGRGSHHKGEYDQTQCDLCGGTMISRAKWHPNKLRVVNHVHAKKVHVPK